MNFFSRLFNKKKRDSVPPIPPFSEIVEMMYDKSLSFSEDLQLVKVIYNEEKTKRFILLKSVNGYYKYTYEELCLFDEEEGYIFVIWKTLFPLIGIQRIVHLHIPFSAQRKMHYQC